MAIESLDLVGVLADVVATHRRMAAARSVPIVTAFPEGEVRIDGDRIQLARTFANLVSNAIKHAEGRPVRVGLERRGDGARVVVSDEGPGIPEADRKRVFDRLVRGTAESDAGAGLGLAIVREFVARHGGQVTLESGPAGGARFVVDLPGDTMRLPLEIPSMGRGGAR
jgi:signal transduction histidine kinase